MFHVKLDAEGPDRMDPESLARLEAFHGLLRDRAVPLGAISRGDRDRLWDRHILDSLRAVACLLSGDRDLLDLGSGAGLPGIPLAVVEERRRFVLVERNAKRAGFIELVVDELSLRNVTVVARPIEDMEGASADVCLSRALGAAVHSWRLARPLLRPRGRLLYYAGRSWREGRVRSAVKGEVDERVCVHPRFDWQGPIVMMSAGT